MKNSSESVVGVILAGGLARRMGGGDKCLLSLAGQTLLQRTIEHAKPQVSTLLLNANGNADRFANTNLTIIEDKFPNNLGPLAGIHAGLSWMRENTSHQWLASFACDTPFFPMTIVETFFEKSQESGFDLVVAKSHQEAQSVFALWHVSLLKKIDAQLTSGKIPRLQDWIKEQNLAYVEFNAEPFDPFFNINTHQDLLAAEAMLLKHTSE